MNGLLYVITLIIIILDFFRLYVNRVFEVLTGKSDDS